MFSRVFAKDIQAGYLKFNVEGGRRRPKARAIVVPGPDAKLNRYGNFTRNYIKTSWQSQTPSEGQSAASLASSSGRSGAEIATNNAAKRITPSNP
jgi:hypothetical protein